MRRTELRAYLEFYRDLGFDSIYVSQAVRQTIGSCGLPAEGPHKTMVRPTEADELQEAMVRLTDTLESIRADIGDCRRCRLCEGRKNIVFGSGNPRSPLVFVGEGPGADEDEQGLPFVGRAGQLLTQMIDNTAAKEGIPIRRGDVYICNVVKCRPPDNRTPLPDEMQVCGEFLYRQIDTIRPKAICVLGATAMKALLNVKEGITKTRGKWHKWRGIPVMVTYHPSYLLRQYNQTARREAWEDLKTLLHYVYD
ncbi:MAG TPA: uracil-DNA glycosylase [Bryobacteraceae bacterium]